MYIKSVLITSILFFSLTIVTTSLFAGWIAPSSAPSESTNTSAPLNLSSVDQTKEGGLAVKTLMVDDAVFIQGGNTTATATGAVSLQVEGKLGSEQFCSELGGGCFTAADMSAFIAAQ